MKKIIVIASIIAFIVVGGYGISVRLSKGEDDFQKGADIVRAQHLKYYAELIEEYKVKTGTYPFMEDAEVPIYVFIATRRQLPEGYPQQQLPFEHKMGSVKHFFNLLEKGLQREIPEYYDPQYAGAGGRPNYYMYVANQGTYFFAVHFKKEMFFTKKVAENYYKVDVSNTPTEMNQAKNALDLVRSKEFLNLVNQPIEKDEFWTARENKTLSDSHQR